MIDLMRLTVICSLSLESCSSTELLTVQFSGVTVADCAATAWLNERLLGKKVWLTLLDHTSQSALDQKAVECIVHSNRKVLLKIVLFDEEC